MLDSGAAATTSMAAGTHLCAESTNRLGGGAERSRAAVATAVDQLDSDEDLSAEVYEGHA